MYAFRGKQLLLIQMKF